MLTPEELAGLEATLLPALERHHLRLLAHGLRTLQAIAGRPSGESPDGEMIRQWVLRQEATAGDDAFAEAFRIQMLNVADQLRGIAGPSCQPLDLELDDLERWARHQADCRLAGSRDLPASAGSTGLD
jgi:hypothetical protein